MSISNPAIALPAALASHFVLDALPHYGRERRFTKKSSIYRWLLYSDMLLAIAVILMAMFLAPQRWFVIGLAGSLAASPDLMWFPHYIAILKNRAAHIKNPLEHFHARIQWGERQWGYVIEIAWFVVAVVVLRHLAFHVS